MKVRTGVAFTLLFAIFALGQTTPEERHTQAVDQLKKVAAEISEKCLTEIHSAEEWNQARPKMRRQLLDMLGLDPMPNKSPLNAVVTGRLDRDEYRIEKLVFQSMPGLYVTGNLYIPKGVSTPMPTILYLCGHAPHPLGAKVHYQDRAAWFAAHGFACFIIDTLEFGEIPGIHHGTHDLNMWNWLSLGYTPAGTEVWNAVRALDYLETRPEVDRNRIGLTGISGGGAITWYTAAVDDRIAAAAPVCSTITFGTQAKHWRAFGQCDCIYYHNAYQWDFPVVAALISPRPLLILSGRQDPDFPPDGYHEVFVRANRIYEMQSGLDTNRIREVDENVGHTDSPLFLREAREWMWRWLKNDNEPFPNEEPNPPLENPEDLAVLKEYPPHAINAHVHNKLIQTANLKTPTTLEQWKNRRDQIVAELKEKVFRWFPQDPIPFKTQSSNRGAGWIPRYADYREITIQTEPNVRIRARLLTPKGSHSKTPLVIYVKRPGSSFYFMDMDELLPLMGRISILILNPRFTEKNLDAVEYADIQRTAAWTGRTIGSMQVWDILRSIDWAVKEGGFNASAISLYGKEDMGILSLYAAVLDERVAGVVLNNPPETHQHGPALLNVLRVTDIPEVAGILAPRSLVFTTPPPAGFELSKKIYAKQGANDHWTVSESLAEAIEIWKWPLSTDSN